MLDRTFAAEAAKSLDYLWCVAGDASGLPRPPLEFERHDGAVVVLLNAAPSARQVSAVRMPPEKLRRLGGDGVIDFVRRTDGRLPAVSTIEVQHSTTGAAGPWTREDCPFPGGNVDMKDWRGLLAFDLANLSYELARLARMPAPPNYRSPIYDPRVLAKPANVLETLRLKCAEYSLRQPPSWLTPRVVGFLSERISPEHGARGKLSPEKIVKLLRSRIHLAADIREHGTATITEHADHALEHLLDFANEVQGTAVARPWQTRDDDEASLPRSECIWRGVIAEFRPLGMVVDGTYLPQRYHDVGANPPGVVDRNKGDGSQVASGRRSPIPAVGGAFSGGRHESMRQAAV